MMHPLAHAVPAGCCAAAALYLGYLIAVDMRAGMLRLRSREAAAGFGIIVAASVSAAISAAPVLAWAYASGGAR